MNDVTSQACPMSALSELFDLSNQQLEQTLNQARAEDPAEPGAGGGSGHLPAGYRVLGGQQV